MSLLWAHTDPLNLLGLVWACRVGEVDPREHSLWGEKQNQAFHKGFSPKKVGNEAHSSYEKTNCNGGFKSRQRPGMALEQTRSCWGCLGCTFHWSLGLPRMQRGLFRIWSWYTRNYSNWSLFTREYSNMFMWCVIDFDDDFRWLVDSGTDFKQDPLWHQLNQLICKFYLLIFSLLEFHHHIFMVKPCCSSPWVKERGEEHISREHSRDPQTSIPMTEYKFQFNFSGCCFFLFSLNSL